MEETANKIQEVMRAEMIQFQTEMMSLENLICKMKSSVVDFTAKSGAEDRISELEDDLHSSPRKQQKIEESLKINKQLKREFWDEFKVLLQITK